MAEQVTRVSGSGLEPERCQWQIERRRRVCCGRQMTQPFAARKLPGTTNGRQKPNSLRRTQVSPGTATGANELNFCVRDGRELARRLWRSQGQAERGPRSARNEPALSDDVSAGHRNRKQVDSPPFPFAYKKDPSFRLSLWCWHYLSSRAVARQVLSAQMSLTSVFGMGTGGPSSQSIPTRMDGC